MVAGMIAPDLRGAIAVAYDALADAERAPDRMTQLMHLRRLRLGLQAMEAAAERVSAMEHSPIPAHWRQQPVALADLPPNVVPIRPVRHIPFHHGGAA
jgi:hypothetical protein